MIDDDFRAGEEMAIAWIEGRSELIDDLGALVGGMPKKLGASERAFLLTIGNAARSAARGEVQPTPAGAPTSMKALPETVAPPSPPVDLEEFHRRRREQARRERLEELARNNAAAWRQDPIATFWRTRSQ